MSAQLKYRYFSSSWDSWDSLFRQASNFAEKVGRENLVSISHSCNGNNEGVVTVWYWEEENSGEMFEINKVNFG